MTEKIKDRLLIEIKKAYATYNRYNAPATFAILHHGDPLSTAELSQFVRGSDGLLKMDENHFFINFSFAKEGGAFKACEHVIAALDGHFGNTDSRIGMTSFDDSHTPELTLERLINIIEEMKKDPELRIEDENLLGSMG